MHALTHLLFCSCMHSPTHLFIRSFVWLVCPSIHSSIHPSVRLSVHRSVRLSVCLYIGPSVHPFIPRFIHPCIHSCVLCMSSFRVRYDSFGSQHTDNVFMLPENITENAIMMMSLNAAGCFSQHVWQNTWRLLVALLRAFPNSHFSVSVSQSCDFSWDHQRIQQTAFRKNCWCAMPAAASTTALSIHIRLISPSDVRMLQFVQRFTSRDYCTGHESDPKHIKTLLFVSKEKGVFVTPSFHTTVVQCCCHVTCQVVSKHEL